MGNWQEAKNRLERRQLIVEGAAWCSTAQFLNSQQLYRAAEFNYGLWSVWNNNSFTSPDTSIESVCYHHKTVTQQYKKVPTKQAGCKSIINITGIYFSEVLYNSSDGDMRKVSELMWNFSPLPLIQLTRFCNIFEMEIWTHLVGPRLRPVSLVQGHRWWVIV